MKKYSLLLIVGDTVLQNTVYATEHSIGSPGYYSFYCDKKLLSIWPIARTVIREIETVEETFED